ncbi:MAG: hypothetical protein WD042_10515 [Phycisphaeraceae bacterium]
MRHADKCLALSAQAGDTQTPFDRASAHGCAAAAFALAGQLKRAQEQLGALTAACDMLDADDDTQVIQRLYVSGLARRFG